MANHIFPMPRLKNEWNYTSSPLYASMAWTEATSLYFFILRNRNITGTPCPYYPHRSWLRGQWHVLWYRYKLPHIHVRAHAHTYAVTCARNIWVLSVRKISVAGRVLADCLSHISLLSICSSCLHSHLLCQGLRGFGAQALNILPRWVD